jgi:TolA-binding protein
MKEYVLITILMAMFVSTAGFAQEPPEGQVPPEEEMEREMHMRNMELELNERQALAEVGERMRQLELKKEHMALKQHEEEMDFDNKMREIELKKQHTKLRRQQKPQKHPACFAHCHKGRIIPLVIVCFIVNVLVAVWVYQDIRKRNSGSGIWIVIALLTGLLGALVYAVVRIGDTGQPKS